LTALVPPVNQVLVAAGFVTLGHTAVSILDTPEFQRLRKVCESPICTVHDREAL
jgi:hypothetical protein